MGLLTGKKALVTAGGQGIGLSITRHLLEAGCDVAVHYFSSQVDLAELRAASPREDVKLVSVQADLCHREEAQACVQQCLEQLGGLDILINNAGSLIGRRRLEELEAEFWQRSFDLNVSSLNWITQAALPALRRAVDGASIVNLASLAGRKGGHPGSLAYSTMKGAVLTYSRALANELGPDGIRVNAIAPGLILGTSFHNTHTTEESARATIAGIPLARAGSPDDVARAVRFLASEYDGFISGATIDINGGVYAC
ncbi:MAG: 3-oxoacyl-acyl-carrier protein reductase [Puniceicoccaceae bacterium 5H]|nr:MAG: 3-oxoacyl-acyl-carrier protein reductase [Puniceicoccaceae bacterium 5H]